MRSVITLSLWLIIVILPCNGFSMNYRRLNHRLKTKNISHSLPSLSNNGISMGLEVKIRMVGRKRGGEKWLDSAYSVYETRLKPANLRVTTHYHKNDDELIKGTEADENKNHKVILLDPLGKMCTSKVFSENMYRWLEEGGSRLTFVIGGAEGLPGELKEGKGNKRGMLSLGMLTFTHQFARIILMEQVYRASEIRKGSGYDK